MIKPPELARQLCARLMMAGAAAPAPRRERPAWPELGVLARVSSADRTIGKICCNVDTPPT